MRWFIACTVLIVLGFIGYGLAFDSYLSNWYTGGRSHFVVVNYFDKKYNTSWFHISYRPVSLESDPVGDTGDRFEVKHLFKIDSEYRMAKLLVDSNSVLKIFYDCRIQSDTVLFHRDYDGLKREVENLQSIGNKIIHGK